MLLLHTQTQEKKKKRNDRDNKTKPFSLMMEEGEGKVRDGKPVSLRMCLS